MRVEVRYRLGEAEYSIEVNGDGDPAAVLELFQKIKTWLDTQEAPGPQPTHDFSTLLDQTVPELRRFKTAHQSQCNCAICIIVRTYDISRQHKP